MKSKHYSYCEMLLMNLNYSGNLPSYSDLYRTFRRTTNNRRLKLFMKAVAKDKVMPSIVWVDEG